MSYLLFVWLNLGPRARRSRFGCHPSRKQFFLSWNKRGTGKRLLAENSAAFHCPTKCPVKNHSPWWHTITQNSTTLANISCLALPATPLTLSLLCAWFGVFLKISLNFVVKYSVGVRYIFCSWWNNAPTLATLSFRQPRQDFAAIPVRPWIRLFLLRYLFSYFVKFHFCFELTYISIWEAFLNSERAFFGCSGRFFSLWCPQPL